MTEVATADEAATAVSPRCRVFNATPLDLYALAANSERIDLPPLKSVEIINSPPQLAILGAPRGMPPLAVLPVGDAGGDLTVRVADLRSAGAPVGIATRPSLIDFVNETDSHVQVVRVDESGGQHAVGVPLRPGGRQQVSGHPGLVWLVRAVFSDEILTGCVMTSHPRIGWHVTMGFLSVVSGETVLPSPLPAGVGPIALVGETRTPPSIDSADYRLVSEFEDPLPRPWFNARPNVSTRTVRIAGAVLAWNSSRENRQLMSYQGKDVLDLGTLEIIADTVVISTALRFPGTTVRIQARVLEFTGKGSIDTTPIADELPAVSRFIDDEKRPVVPVLGTDGKEKLPAKGDQKQFRARDGRDGERGGDIEIAVASLVVPPGDEVIRFRTSGSAGQRAEAGGVRDWVKTDPAADKLDPPAITEDTIQSKFRGTFTVAQDFWKWTWPANGDRPTNLNFPDRRVRLGSGGNVVDLVIVCHDDMSGDTNVFGFPGDDNGPTKDYSMGRVGNGPIADQRGALGNAFTTGRRVRPGNGPDAFPGGRPGNGGPAGVVRTTTDAGAMAALVDVSGGAAGAATAAVPGGAPGTPTPAFRVQLNIIRNGLPFFIPQTSQPNLIVEEVTGRAGRSEPERCGEPGADGRCEQWTEPWASPEAIDAVLAFARDAYRAGHRDLARRALEPYYAALQSHAVSPDVQARMISIEAMRSNLRNNLDYYGNPPGWVPRMRLSTNLDYFQAARQMSYRLLYYAATAEQKFDTLTAKSELAHKMGEVLDQEMTVRVALMAESTVELTGARDKLIEVSREVAQKQAALDVVTQLAEQEALGALERQRIFRGICKTIAGVTKIVPAGQPYLGAVGDLINGVGEVDFSRPNQVGKQISDVAAKVGSITDSFLQKNGKVLTDDRTGAARDRVAADKAQAASLADHLRRTKAASEDLARAVEEDTKPIESQWANARTEELKQLKAQLGAVNDQIADYSGATEPKRRAAEKAAKEAQERLIARLGALEASSLQSYRRGLNRSIADLEGQIADAGAHGDLSVDLNLERVERLKREKDELAKSKLRAVDVERQQKDLAADTARHTEELQKQKEEFEGTLTQLRSVATGISGLGAAIATLATPTKRDDPDVKALGALLIKSAHADEYQRLLDDFEEIGRKQTRAMARLTAAQQAIANNTAAITENLTAQLGWSRQRQALEGVLDIRAKRYLKDMQARAKDMLRRSLYYVEMAYRYEFLHDLDEEIVDYEKIVARLRPLEEITEVAPKPGSGSAPVGSGPSGTPQSGTVPPGTAAKNQPASFTRAPVAADKKKTLDDDVLQMGLWSQSNRIFASQQSRATAAQKNKANLALTADEREQLRQTGEVRINLVERGVANYRWEDGRITEITIDTIDLEMADMKLTQESGSLRFTFRHSGVNILRGRTPAEQGGESVFYFFQAAEWDDTISWGTTYNHLATGSKISKDERLKDRDEFTKKSTGSGGTSVTFLEYQPSVFGDLTLSLTGTRIPTKEAIREIKNVAFTVNYSLVREVAR